MQQSSYFNSSRSMAGKFYEKKNRVFGFFSLQSVNDSLVRENAVLKGKLGISLYKNPLRDSGNVKTTTKDSMKTVIYYHFLPAKVLNNSIDMKRNYITLDKGSADGIKVKMAVISDKGVVGRISHVSSHFSVAQSLLSDELSVSAQVPDGTVGVAFWEGKDASVITLRGMPQSVKLKKGDSITTTGYSYFPEGILIGKVIAPVKDKYTVQCATNFRNLHYVYIVEDKTNVERYLFEEVVKDSLKKEKKP